MQSSKIKIIETSNAIWYPETPTLNKLIALKPQIDALMEFMLFACGEKHLKIGFQHDKGYISPGGKYHTDDEVDDLINDGTLEWKKTGPFGVCMPTDKDGKTWDRQSAYFETVSPEGKKFLDILASHFGIDREKESDERDAALRAWQMHQETGKKLLQPEEWKKLLQPA